MITPTTRTTAIAIGSPLRAGSVGAGGSACPAYTEGPRLARRRRARNYRAGRSDWERRVPYRPRHLRTARAIAPLGDGGRGLAPNHLQHRADALHAGDRGAGVLRFHAHAAVVDWLGVGIHRPLRCCHRVGPRLPPPRQGPIFFLSERRLPGPQDAAAIYYIGVVTFLACAAVLLVGRRIERTLELLNWVLIVVILSSLLVLDVLLVPSGTWVAAAAGLGGFDVARGTFNFLPPDTDFFLLGALVALSGSGGVTNIVLSNWARDKGYGMGELAGYIPAAIGGHKVNLAHSGFVFAPSDEAMRRWRGWWRVVRADQWGVFFTGAILGMVLPALLYVTFIPQGSDIQGLGISAALASERWRKVGARARRVHCIPRCVDPDQDTTRQPRRDGARHYRHPLDRQLPRARVARWRRARGVLQCAGHRRPMGYRGASLGTAHRPAEALGQMSRVWSSSWRRCICSTSTRGCCRHTCARPCGGARSWWGWRSSTGSSSPSRSVAYGAAD